MVLLLLAHLVMWLLVGALAALIYAWATRRATSSSSLLGPAGFWLLVLWLGWFFVPFASPLAPKLAMVKVLPRKLEWFLAAALVVMALYAVIRILGATMGWGSFIGEVQGRNVFNDCEQTNLGASRKQALYEEKRQDEEDYWRRRLDMPYLSLHWVDVRALPWASGILYPTVYAPLWMLEASEDTGRHFTPLMDRVMVDVRTGAWRYLAALASLERTLPLVHFITPAIRRAFEQAGDRTLLASAASAQQDALLESMRYAAEKEIRDGSLSDSAFVATDRIRRATARPATLFLLAPIAALFSLGLFGCVWVGGFNAHMFQEFLLHHEIVGYKLRVFDAGVSYAPLMGHGGVLPDGLAMNTLAASGLTEVPSAQVRIHDVLQRTLPQGTEAIHLSFDWRIRHRSGGEATDAPAVSTRMTEAVSDGPGYPKKPRWVYDFRYAILDPSRTAGTVTLPIRLRNDARRTPNSTDDLYGPELCVPPGWNIEFTNFRAVPVPAAQVPPTRFPEDVIPFVEWYRRHTRPMPVSFSWDGAARR